MTHLLIIIMRNLLWSNLQESKYVIHLTISFRQSSSLVVLQISHDFLRDLLRDVQRHMVPRSTLNEWAVHTFPDATDYWTFRKSFTLHLALLAFAEYSFFLTRLRPEMLQVAQDSGHLCASYFRLTNFCFYNFLILPFLKITLDKRLLILYFSFCTDF